MLDVSAERKSVVAVPRHWAGKNRAILVCSYFVASLAVVVAALFALDRWIIPGLENAGYLESYLWTDENHKLNHFTYLKNDARKTDPVWRSQYLPVTPAHPGKKRIMVVGDSFVWGDGSNNVNTLWWRQLDLELKRRGYGDVEVIAAGLNGASTEDELGWLPVLLPKYKPDLVIFGFVTNDPDQAKADGHHFVHMMQKELPDQDQILAKLNRFFPNLTGQLRQIRKLALQAHLSTSSDMLEYADWELALLKGDNFKSFKKTVEELSAYLKAQQIPAMVIALPAGFQNKTRENTAANKNFFANVRDYNAERFSKVKPLYDKAGLLFVDTTDAFASAAAADPYLKSSSSALRLGINPGNGHPGPFSTHFYARSAADTLEKTFPSLLSPAQDHEKGVRVNDCMPPYMNLQADAANKNTFDFTYPPDLTEHTLYMPLRRKHVQLSLSQPSLVSAIELQGVNLSSAQLYLNFYDDKLGYAPDLYTALPLKKGSVLRWEQFGPKKLNAVKLRAGFKGANQGLKIRFIESSQ